MGEKITKANVQRLKLMILSSKTSIPCAEHLLSTGLINLLESLCINCGINRLDFQTKIRKNGSFGSNDLISLSWGLLTKHKS